MWWNLAREFLSCCHITGGNIPGEETHSPSCFQSLKATEPDKCEQPKWLQLVHMGPMATSTSDLYSEVIGFCLLLCPHCHPIHIYQMSIFHYVFSNTKGTRRQLNSQYYKTFSFLLYYCPANDTCRPQMIILKNILIIRHFSHGGNGLNESKMNPSAFCT